MNDLVIDTGYDPRPFQMRLHNSLKRFNVLVCHRRFGKTVCAINEMIDQALNCEKPNPVYMYVAPYRNWAKDVAWNYIKMYADKLPGVEFNEAELNCFIPNGSDTITIRVRGADKPKTLKGAYYDGVVLDEFAEMDPLAWSEAIRPALGDRLGWAIFIGTPKGKNAFYELYERAQQGGDWFAAMYKASETGVLPPEELEAIRRDIADEDVYAQEMECSFSAAIKGAYYGTLMNEAEQEGRIKPLPKERALKVDTAWDLGIGDSTAIWFVQRTGREIRLIDYYEASGVGLDHYAKVLQQKAMEHGYIYGEHLLPHDAEVKELGSGRSRLETLHGLGFSNTRIVPKLAVDDGINAVRTILPRCWFDAETCKRGIEALRQYRCEYNEKNRAFKSSPLHDWTSHCADAFRYLAVTVEDESPEGRRRDRYSRDKSPRRSAWAS